MVKTEKSASERRKRAPATPTTSALKHRTRGRSRDGAAFPLPPLQAELPAGYARLVGDIKVRIQRARLAAAVAVNQELLLLYYSIGFDLDRRLKEESWGSGIIDRVSADLRAAFPEMDGLSPRNLRRMRGFYRSYPLDTAASGKMATGGGRIGDGKMATGGGQIAVGPQRRLAREGQGSRGAHLVCVRGSRSGLEP